MALTLIEAVCLAGSRHNQNDDAFGITMRRAFVVDGATDLIEQPLCGARSDASWLARHAAIGLSKSDQELSTRKVVGDIAVAAADEWRLKLGDVDVPTWSQPSATMLIVTELGDSLEVLRLGDCSAYIWNADGVREFADPTKTDEGGSARLAGASARLKLDFDKTSQIDVLRSKRVQSITSCGVLGLNSNCARNAVIDLVPISSPTYVLAMTDGFSAIADSYGRYSTKSLLEASLDIGLAKLAEELRCIEVADPLGNHYPRWKTSDDATAVLCRID